MRCRPGDLAVVVNDIEDARNNGSLITVLRLADQRQYSLPVDWECEAVSTIRMGAIMFKAGAGGFGYRDCEIRPIRDPGDDAKDEMLRPLPQEVTA